MARTTVAIATAAKSRVGGSLVAHLVDETGHAFGLHYTPETADLSGGGNNYASVARQGRTPLVRYQDSKVRQLTFTSVLGPRITGTTPTRAMHDLMQVADTVQKLRLINVTGGIETAGWWRVTDLTVKITERDVNQQVKTAELSWTMLQANDDRPKIGRPPPPPKKKPPAKRKPAAPAPHYQADWVVRRGDCLWSIAYWRLGSGTRWPEIFRANVAKYHIPPAVMYRNLLTVWIMPGWVLKIPAR